MNKLKQIIASLVLTFFSFGVFAQTDSKDVSITSSGSGKTLEDAKQSALRSATEQAFGAFISSKTEMFNDQVVADQMASVSSGNIKSYEVLNQAQLPDGRWGVTLKSVVSVDKLTSFVQAKGITIEVKGGLFALNIKQQMLNEEGEVKAIAEMVGLLHEPMQTSFDYVVTSSNPISLDAESKYWDIPLTVTATANKNLDFCANYFIKTLKALSLSPAEAETYKSLNKQVYKIAIDYKGAKTLYNLRRKKSLDLINSILSNWEFYMRLFKVDSGLEDAYKTEKKEQYHELYDNGVIFFLTIGQKAGTFSWKEWRTLSQIEQIKSYSVTPNGVISQFKNGGYIVYEKDGHGLVAAIIDLGKMDWSSANTACEELILNGYSDWHLPSKEELNSVYVNLKQVGVGGFADNYYWSSTEGSSYSSWKKGERDRGDYNYSKPSTYNVRAVRAF